MDNKFEAILKKIQNPLMRAFYEDGAKYIATVKATDNTDPSFSISPDMPEWVLWGEYLMRRIGFLPWAMKEVRAGRLTNVTMPARYPYWFDVRSDEVAEAKLPRIGPPSRQPMEEPTLPAGRLHYWELNGQRPIGRFEDAAPGKAKPRPRPEQQVNWSASDALKAKLQPPDSEAAE